MASLEKSIEKHSKGIEKILVDKFTLRPDWAKCAVAEITDLLKDWSKGDEGAHAVLHKLVRGEFQASNYHAGQLRTLALKALVSVGPKSVEDLLSLLRDSQGNLLFNKEEYRYWPHEVLDVLEDLALAGLETKRLVYEFISIGAKLDKMGVAGDHKASCALADIKRAVYSGDERGLFSPPFPPLSEDEKDFLALRTYKSYAEFDSGKNAGYDLGHLIDSKSIGDLIFLFNKLNRSDRDILQALIGFIDDQRVPPELLKIFTEGAIRLGDQDKALALKALGKVPDHAFKGASVIYRCKAIKDSTRTYETSVEICVSDLLVLLDIAYLNFKTFSPAIPLLKDVSEGRGTWFEVRDKRISRLTFAQGRGIWNSTICEITSLPDSMGDLAGLVELDLSGQSMLKTLPTSLKDLKNLILRLDGTGIA